jgi:hypothetical protein
MTITKTCNTCEHFPNDNHCIGCEWDKSKGENSKWELKKNPIVIERKVLEQIRDAIEREADYQDANVNADVAKGLYMALEMIDKHTK